MAMDKKNESRRFFKKTDFLWLGGVALLCAAALFWWYGRAPAGAVRAVISVGGRPVRVIELATAPDETFTLPEQPKVSFQIQGGRIRFVNVDCPDKLCEKAGWLSKPNQVAICLPNRVSLKLEGGGDGMDAIVN